jgi:hypothetical protein
MRHDYVTYPQRTMFERALRVFFRPRRLASLNLLVAHGRDSALRVSQVTRNAFLTYALLV